jgi:hypothetical protein
MPTTLNHLASLQQMGKESSHLFNAFERSDTSRNVRWGWRLEEFSHFLYKVPCPLLMSSTE